MANFNEQEIDAYDWDMNGVYVIKEEDSVQGGIDGISNRQAKELTMRTRDLHERIKKLEAIILTLIGS